jgi:hypothetical protein
VSALTASTVEHVSPVVLPLFATGMLTEGGKPVPAFGAPAIGTPFESAVAPK